MIKKSVYHTPSIKVKKVKLSFFYSHRRFVDSFNELGGMDFEGQTLMASSCSGCSSLKS